MFHGWTLGGGPISTNRVDVTSDITPAVTVIITHNLYSLYNAFTCADSVSQMLHTKCEGCMDLHKCRNYNQIK